LNAFKVNDRLSHKDEEYLFEKIFNNANRLKIFELKQARQPKKCD